jgi:glucans biosynthesis protein
MSNFQLQAEEFSFESLAKEAREIAARPYFAPVDSLAAYWKGLNYDQHRDIRFKMDSGLWAGGEAP